MEDLIQYYHQQMYTETEIPGFLILRHGRQISQTRYRRIIRALKLRRYNNEASVDVISEGIIRLFESGFGNAGYRTIWRLLNVTLGVRATQVTVNRLLQLLDPEGLVLRRGRRLRRRIYSNGGPNCIIHIDGYDKLKPYGFSIHGAIDGFSRKLLWLKVLRSNKNPYSISKLYLDMVSEHGRVPKVIRCDAGTENVVVKDLQLLLRNNHEDVIQGGPCCIVNRSTGNQRIEAFWSFLKRIFTVKWRNMFMDLEQIGLFESASPDDIENMRMWFSSVIQLELDHIKSYWNSHRIRLQRDVELTTGQAPDVMYYQPELFSARDCSLPLPCTANELLELFDHFSVVDPPHGCSDSFMARISLLSGLPRESIENTLTTADALQMFMVTKDLLKSQSQDT